MSFLKKLFGSKNKPDDVGLTNGEFRQKVLDVLSKQYPDIDAIPSQEDVSVILIGEGYADVTNLAAHARSYPQEDVTESIHNFVQTLVQTFDPSLGFKTEEIVVVLRPQEYIDHIQSIRAKIISFPWVGDLHAVYMEDTPTAMRALDTEILKENSQEDIHKMALDNIRPWMAKLWSEDPASPICLYNVTDNTFLITGMVFLDEFWSYLESRHGKEFLFAYPRKDQLFVFNTSHPDALDFAQKMIKVTWEENFNLLTPMVFRRRDGQIEVVKAN